MTGSEDPSSPDVMEGTQAVRTTDEAPADENNARGNVVEDHALRMDWSMRRSGYCGSLAYNFVAFLLPVIYTITRNLWVAEAPDLDISSSAYAKHAYIYVVTVIGIMYEAMPNTTWLIIGDNATRSIISRISLSYTLICFQAFIGLLAVTILLIAAPALALPSAWTGSASTSSGYIRIDALYECSTIVNFAIFSCARALDHPEIPVSMSAATVLTNLVLELLVTSRFHIGFFEPTYLLQLGMQGVGEALGALVGLVYFSLVAGRLTAKLGNGEESSAPSFKSLRVLAHPALWTVTESAIRNLLLAWMMARFVQLSDYQTYPCYVFSYIRQYVVMVPAQALVTSTLTFVGHNFSQWRAQVGIGERGPTMTRAGIKFIIQPAVVSVPIVLAIEVPMCFILSHWAIGRFALYLFGEDQLSYAVPWLWQRIDWCYVLSTVSSQVAAILLATTPRWYLYQSLAWNLLWMLPWAIAITKTHLPEDSVQKCYAIMLGGAQIFAFFASGLVSALWAWRIMRGRMKRCQVQANL